MTGDTAGGPGGPASGAAFAAASEATKDAGSDTGFDPGEYGRHIAADYDDLTAHDDATAAADCLADLAAGGPVLEFGIGTGRLALPLLDRGLAVTGIDGSPAMLEILAAKGRAVPTVVGDFATTTVAGTFALVLLAVNTIYALPSQDAQVACFRNAARHLDPGGVFVVEAWVPDLGAFRAGRALRPVVLSDRRVVLEAAEVDPVSQRMQTTKIFLDDRGARARPAHHRYAWPAELDLMARLAGMRLLHRWSDWHRAAFTATSTQHVSVWQRVEGVW